MAHLRTFQAGKNSAMSQELLNELAAARGCLLNLAKKAAYDERLHECLQAASPSENEPGDLGPIIGVAVVAGLVLLGLA
jgi:hypothetical protein